jgi:hypothetical protein
MRPPLCLCCRKSPCATVNASWLAAIVEWSVSHAVGRLVWCTGMVRPPALCVGTADVVGSGRSSVVRCMLLARGVGVAVVCVTISADCARWLSSVKARHQVRYLRDVVSKLQLKVRPRPMPSSSAVARCLSTAFHPLHTRLCAVPTPVRSHHSPTWPRHAPETSGNFRFSLGPASRTDRSTHLG